MKWLLLYSDCLVFPSFVCCGTWPSPVLVSWLASCPGYWHLLVLGCSLLMWLLPLLSSCFKSSHFLFFHLWYPVQVSRFLPWLFLWLLYSCCLLSPVTSCPGLLLSMVFSHVASLVFWLWSILSCFFYVLWFLVFLFCLVASPCILASIIS